MTTAPTDGPWLYASACGVTGVDGAGNLAKVGCPSRFCPPGMLVPLDEHGRITPHDGMVPGECPFIGYRVVPDPGVDLRDPARRRP
ncbi:hypothetical protein [Nocardia wallacei]|uniref:hypothetical protein n=1 Tax=Nocardia wallacei TaxID=480035 RepID=UPI002459019F|nr:hypothetical protein [Nocardia wallacei]